jgi:hypothetical protein
MTVDSRSKLLQVLDEIGRIDPDVRLGQLMVTLAYIARGPKHEVIWDVEDDELLAATQQDLANLAKRNVLVP